MINWCNFNKKGPKKMIMFKNKYNKMLLWSNKWIILVNIKY